MRFLSNLLSKFNGESNNRGNPGNGLRLSLCDAAAWGNYEECVQMIENGEDVNQVDKNGWSPLHRAIYCSIQSHQLAICSLLLDKGADINKMIDNDKWWPLNLAASRGQLATCKLLIEKGADIHLVSQAIGWSALHAAATNGHAGICLLLLENGADINIVDKTGKSPLAEAVFSRKDEVCTLLLNFGADVNLRDQSSRTPLYVAAEGSSEARCLLLLQHGADVNQTNHAGYSPLHVAICRDNIALCSLLIKYGANVQLGDSMNVSTPFQLAYKAKRVDISILLIRNGGYTDHDNKHSEHIYHIVKQELVILLLLFQRQFMLMKDSSDIYNNDCALYRSIISHDIVRNVIGYF